MFDSILHSWHFRDGFSSLLNGDSSGDASQEASTQESTSQQETHIDGGRVQRSTVYVRSDRLAMKVSAWFAGVRILSENAAACLLKYQRWNAAEKRYVDTEDAYDRRLFYILTVRPNKRMTRFEFYKNLYARRINEGNAFVFVSMDTLGKPWEQFLLSKDAVTYDVQSDTYKVTDTTQGIVGTYNSNGCISGRNGWILHFKDFCLDGGFVGVPRIQYAATQLGIAQTGANETLDSFARHGTGKYIYHDRQDASNFTAMTDTQMADNVKDIQDQLNQNADVVILRGQGQLDPMSMDSAQLQWLSKEEFNIREIARFLGVPLMKLFEKGDQTYKSSDAANTALYNEGLRPMLEATANEYNAKLIPWTLASSYRYWYDTTPLYTSDKMTEADYLLKRIQSGTMTVNEARETMNLSPVEGGDAILVSTNLADINSEKLKGNGAPSQSQE